MTAQIEVGELPARAADLLARGYRVALMAAHDDKRLVYLFTRPHHRTELHVRLSAPEFPSLAALSFPAGRFEREIRDLYGLTPSTTRCRAAWCATTTGHAAGTRCSPTRAAPAFGDPEGPYPFGDVAGDGVYEIPVGPVHAGMIEPGHFRFSVVGETILKLKARLWFVHKGIEKLFLGRRPEDGLELAERVSGDTSAGHALAYCLAVEEATGIAVDPDAQRARAVILELERLYNHVTDLGALCNDVAHGILNAHCGRVRERLLRLNAEVTGHRLLRGAITPGGVHPVSLPAMTTLREIGADLAEITGLALGHGVVADRFTGTAVLSRRAAADLGTLGYVARASGLDTDARRDHPFADVGPFQVSTRTSGDVMARFQVRADEVATSIDLIEHLLGSTQDWSLPGAHRDSGVGIVEGWRGTIVHRVELSSGRLTRVKIVDPSFFNWPALPVALDGAIVPDFPLVNKSFNLSYAANDL